MKLDDIAKRLIAEYPCHVVQPLPLEIALGVVELGPVVRQILKPDEIHVEGIRARVIQANP